MSAAVPSVRARGLTLVELMVSIALGLLIVLVTTGLLLSTRVGYLAQNDDAQLQESGRFALELIGRAVRQAAYEHLEADAAPVLGQESMSAHIAGLNARRLKATAAGLDDPVADKSVVNGSDVLAVRFFGTDDGTMFNCAGYAVPAPASHDTANEDRGWSVFYVGTATNGEKVLYCKYQGKGSPGKPGAWQAESIATGVESFQVLYGVDINDDGVPDRYMHAAAVDALDAQLVLTASDAAARKAELNRKTYWKRVLVVHVALLVRGNHDVRADEAVQVYDLFGAEYSRAYGSQDPGVRMDESAFPAAERKRLRRVFSTSIQLRNRSAGSAA